MQGPHCVDLVIVVAYLPKFCFHRITHTAVVASLLHKEFDERRIPQDLYHLSKARMIRSFGIEYSYGEGNRRPKDTGSYHLDCLHLRRRQVDGSTSIQGF